MDDNWTDQMRSLLDGPSPAVLTTYRKDGTALTSPVWFRWHAGAFEVVIAAGDVKLRHLSRRPECTLVVFEATPPFRGIEVRGEPELQTADVTRVRTAIASRYLGPVNGKRFGAARNPAGAVLRLRADAPRTWDLSAILP